MDKERDNLRLALSYAMDSGQSELLLRLIGAAFWLWWLRGPWSEGQKWVEIALAAASFKPTVLKAKALMALGLFSFSQSDYSKSQKFFEESILIWESLEDELWYIFSTTMLGYILHHQKQHSASDVLRNALQMAREMNDKWLLALCLLTLGEHEFYNGNLTGGRSMMNESLELIHTLGDHMIRGDVFNQLGEIADAEHDYSNALRWYKDGLAIAREVGDMDSVINLEFNMGRISQVSNENDQAVHLFMDVLQESLRIGRKSMVTAALSGLAVVAHARGDLERAVRLFYASNSLYENLSSKILIDPADHVWLDEHFTAARAQLGEEKYSALGEEGKKMTLEQAVNYALEGIKNNGISHP
jgi:tetratricopeptide (TPR) repeat protein